MKKRAILSLSALLIWSMLPLMAGAASYTNTTALQGVKEAKVYFDVTIGEPKKLVTRLQLIETTYSQLAESGIPASFVIGFRGKASNYVTKADDYVLEEDLPEKQQIAVLIKSFTSLGFRLEQCFIAAGFEGIEPNDFLPALDIVANGYISMISYQAKGYAFVPMD